MPPSSAPRCHHLARRAASVLAIGGALIGIAACSFVEQADPPVDTTPVVVDTVGGVGLLPAFVAQADQPASTTPVTGVPLDPSGDPGLGRAPAGNRVLLIGDSIFAATSTRLGGEMCAALEPLGWQVAVEAEVSRQVTFGVDVLRARGEEGWDVGVVFLGTNYNGDNDDYLQQLNRIITEFGMVPVVLLTASRHSEAMDEVNAVIRGLDELYPHVTVIDWEAVTADDPGLLVADGVHPSTAGRAMLTALVASHLGRAPAAQAGPAEGGCLESVFVDDSLGEMPDLDAPAATAGPASRPTTTTAAPMSSSDGADSGDGANGDTSSGDGATGDGADAPAVPDDDPEQEPPADV